MLAPVPICCFAEETDLVALASWLQFLYCPQSVCRLPTADGDVPDAPWCCAFEGIFFGLLLKAGSPSVRPMLQELSMDGRLSQRSPADLTALAAKFCSHQPPSRNSLLRSVFVV